MTVDLDKQLYLVELDDVLFPKRDYLIQVYYLFGSFLEFGGAAVKALDIAEYMKNVLDEEGEDAVLPRTMEKFNLDDSFYENYQRLKTNAQLPLPLELIPTTASLLLDLFQKKKKIAILTKGNPVEQLNKLKFLNWGDIDLFKSQLKVYFIDELVFRGFVPESFVAEDQAVDVTAIQLIDTVL